MLTVGQLAELAGVTVRTVRYYHQRGLLPEPGRDASGYRRYTSAHLIRLLRIRGLTEIGIPLTEVDRLLDAPRSELARTLDDLDAQLAAQAERIAGHRAVIARLRGTDPRIPAHLHPLAERLRSAGVPESAIAAERDAVLLAEAVGGRGTSTWTVADFYAGFDDPALSERLLRAWQRFEQLEEADRAEVDAVVAEFVDLFATHLQDVGAGEQQGADPLARLLIEDHVAALPPAKREVVQRVAAHFGG
ncbi:MerR family transcriptional regulator [Auraticoccus cholistanensis]|uniref:MerR family transcriptional regulator n=1 Tax=Auraticoccus cholistanensis TaxID=2656650 RepID=UPI0018D23BBA